MPCLFAVVFAICHQTRPRACACVRASVRARVRVRVRAFLGSNMLDPLFVRGYCAKIKHTFRKCSTVFKPLQWSFPNERNGHGIERD